MRQLSTLDVGFDVHQASIAGAYIAHEHGAEVTDLGTIGTRPWDIDHLLRKMPSKAKQLVVVSEAGPWGDGLYRISPNKATTAGLSPRR